MRKQARALLAALPTILLVAGLTAMMSYRVAAEQPESLDTLATFLCAQHDGVRSLNVAGDTDHDEKQLIGTWAPREVHKPGWAVFAVRCRDGHAGRLAMRWETPLPEEEAVAQFKVKLAEEEMQQRLLAERRARELMEQNAYEARQRILAEHGEEVKELAALSGGG